MPRQTVEKIVANPTTDGIILILNDGNVIPHSFGAWATVTDMAPIKEDFAGEVSGDEDLAQYGQQSYDMYAFEVEHFDAVTVYTANQGWLI